MKDRIKVMFVCTGNSARSQMAEGFARHFCQGRVEAYSAGTEPSRLNPLAVAVMQEKGIDISREQSKAFDEDLARRMDVVVTVCGNADERCPVLPPEVKRVHWPLEDPAAAKGTDAEILARFREIRDQTEVRRRHLSPGLKSSGTSGRRLLEAARRGLESLGGLSPRLRTIGVASPS